MILDKARQNGASVWEETKAKALLKSEERIQGIRVESAEFGSQELFAPIVVDASGSRLLCRHQAELDGP